MRVEFSVGQAGLQALRASWSHILCHKRRPRFFHEWSWYRAYLEHLEPDPRSVCFALVTDADEPVAIVPLQRAFVSFHGLSSRLWRLPEHDHLPLADVVAADGVSGNALLAVVLEGLQRRGTQWDQVQFTGFGEDSCLRDVTLTHTHVTCRDVLTSSDQVICDQPWDAFARRLSANFRSNLNKARHKLEHSGGASYAIVSDPQDLVALFPEFLRVEASGWKGLAGTRTAVALAPQAVGFYRALIDHFAPAGRVYINMMYFAERVIASQFCIAESDTLYVLKQGYDESFSRFAPGNSLLEQLVCWCYATRKFRAIDQVGRPRWFQDWKPVHSSNVYRLHVFNSTPVGQIHRFKYAARARLRAMRASLRPTHRTHRVLVN